MIAENIDKTKINKKANINSLLLMSSSSVSSGEDDLEYLEDESPVDKDREEDFDNKYFEDLIKEVHKSN